MVICRIRLNKQSSEVYCLAFKMVLERCPSGNILGLVVDWSDAQIKGLQMAVSYDKADSLMKEWFIRFNLVTVADKVS